MCGHLSTFITSVVGRTIRPGVDQCSPYRVSGHDRFVVSIVNNSFKHYKIIIIKKIVLNFHTFAEKWRTRVRLRSTVVAVSWPERSFSCRSTWRSRAQRGKYFCVSIYSILLGGGHKSRRQMNCPTPLLRICFFLFSQFSAHRHVSTWRDGAGEGWLFPRPLPSLEHRVQPPLIRLADAYAWTGYVISLRDSPRTEFKKKYLK